MWAFETKKQRFAESDPDWELPGQAPVSPAEAVLGEVLTRKGARLGYNYDFGDDWWLAIISEGRAQAEPGMRYPRCVAGERAGPPEDCGGPPGFDGLLEARRNPKSRDARELLEWVGPDWNPDAFDVGQMNKALAALFAPRRKR